MRWLLFIGLAWASDPSLEVGPITFEELDALSRQKAWSEMVFRLKEVPAADRNARWEAFVEKAALGHLDTISSQGGTEVGATASTLLSDYPSPRRSRKYLDKRTEATFTSLRKCYDNPLIDDECGGRLLTFAEGESRDLPLIRRAAGLVAAKETSEAVLPFLKLALSKHSRDKICRDEFWQKSLVDALAATDADPVREARALAGKECWPQIKARIVAEMARKPPAAGVLCDLLREKKSLPPDRSKLCPAPSPKP